MAAVELNEEWRKICSDYQTLEELHTQYKTKVDEIEVLQSKCKAGVLNQNKRLKELSAALKVALTDENVANKESNNPNGDACEQEEIKTQISDLRSIKEKIEIRKNEIRDIEDVLPKDNGWYLRTILGTVNVSLITKAEKYAYKNDYELFKLRVTLVVFSLSLMIMTVLKYRFWETLLTFLLVWYYCTLTIRETILTINGSRIKGWWVTHHFVSTMVSGVLLVWPDGTTYQMFRTQFIAFVFYLSFVQFLQYYYQRGCLYRLRALGESHNMDITVEGFQSWMWKGLSFLLPFLSAAYLFQLYNAFVLLRLSFHPDCDEWQVPLLSFLFLVLFVGNVGTTLLVIRKKVGRGADYLWALRNKYKMD